MKAEENRMFPIMLPRGALWIGAARAVPWSLVEDHESQALSNHSQTLERLAERGGLAPCELHAVVHDRPWRRLEEVGLRRWYNNISGWADEG